MGNGIIRRCCVSVSTSRDLEFQIDFLLIPRNIVNSVRRLA